MNNFKTLFFFSITLCLFFSFSLCAITPWATLSSKDSSNKISQIAESRRWKKLLHVEKNALYQDHFQISDPEFYLYRGSEVKTPRLELLATIEAFFEPAHLYSEEVSLQNKKMVDESRHAICRFPARLEFLKEVFSAEIDWEALPKPRCEYQNIYLRAVEAQSLSFVFSSYYSDSPGSAFGHTFFRLNKEKNPDKRLELLDFGLGFAANVNVNNPFLYVVLGLTGGFDGTWTNLPYYFKVREYNDFESRDLWSYDLNLSEIELDRFVKHLWEIGNIKFHYFFFSQNCAYHMLTALEAASDRLDLSSKVPLYYVIPTDSLKTLFKQEGLVQAINYRPSLRKVFREKIKLLPLDKKMLFEENVKALQTNMDLNLLKALDDAFMVDLMIDYLQVLYPHIEKNPTALKLKDQLLAIRAKNPTLSEIINLKYAEEDRPELSHGSTRSSLGYVDQKIIFDHRFAIHDLLDSSTGMPPNSELEFFRLQIESDLKKTVLKNAHLFRVRNLNPLSLIDSKPSWGVDIVHKREDKWLPSTYSFSGVILNAGYSLNLRETIERPWFLWAMAQAELGYSTYKNKNTSWGLGYDLGSIFRFDSQLAGQVSFKKIYFAKNFFREEFELEARYFIQPAFAVSLNYSKQQWGTWLRFYY